MTDIYFSLHAYLKQRPSLLEAGESPCKHNLAAAGSKSPSLTSPADAGTEAGSYQYSHVVEEDEWFEECLENLVDSVQVAQYDYLDFPTNRLETLEASPCLIDRYTGPVIEIMHSVFLQKGRSPLIVVKETLQVENESFETFSLSLQNPERTQAPIHTLGQPIRYWPCGIYGIFLPPGSLARNTNIVQLLTEDSVVSKMFAVLRAGLAKRGVNVPFGIMSDQTTTLAVYTLTEEYDRRGFKLCTGGFVSDAHSLRYILAALSYRILYKHRISRYPKRVPHLPLYLGASPSQVPDNPEDPRWFSDFDMYTMQRDWNYWQAFLEWREKIEYEGSQERLEVGNTIRLESRGFEKRIAMFAPSSHRKLPLSKVTFDSVHANRRPRDETTDALLNANGDLSFTVTRIVRAGTGEWSQVVFGRLAGYEKELCLKILDERRFPALDEYDTKFWHSFPACSRLPSLVFSEDLVNREAAVYCRLQELQGSLLPHCYGFHLITLPSGWQAYSILLELIDGPTAYELLDSQPLGLEDQKALFTSIKHGISALGHVTISQSDWNTDNIMYPLDPSGKRTAVFIDFAFAYLHLGDEEGVRSFADTEMVAANLGWGFPGGSDYIKSIWGPKDDFAF